MNLNLKGKAEYVANIVKHYPKWYSVFIGRILNKPLEKVQLSNGLIITGGDRSLITNLIYDIFIKEVYNPEFMKINQGDTVVDIGANVGVFSLYAANRGASDIYSIEPLPQNTLFLRRNFNINNLKLPKIIVKALSDRKGKSKFRLGDIDSHGLIFDNGHKEKTPDLISVHTDTLENIITKNNIVKIDFLKIDCEGGEGRIISSLPDGMWKTITKFR
jgi:FkbM family methyltransferase